MSAEVVQCPSCGGETRVPEALFGKAVKCPLCGTTYVAPVFEDGRLVSDATVPPMVTGSRGDGQGDGRGRGRYRRDERRDRNTNQVVGLAMMLVGVVSLLVSGFQLQGFLADEEGAKQTHIQNMKEFFKALKRDEPTEEELADSWNPGVVLKLYAAGVAASVLILAGAASILSRRFYGYACFSTVAAMLNLSNCCCIMGLPIGVWTLIVLLNPDVRRLYRRGGPTGDPDSGRAGVGDL